MPAKSSRRVRLDCACDNGFSLLEMLIVLAIIGIILVASIPSGGGKVDRARIVESIELLKNYKPQIERYYRFHDEFPVDNASAGLPDPMSIVGNYVAATYLENGALHLQLGNKINPKLHGKFVSLRPVFVPGVKNTPVSWICGNDTVPPQMVAAGTNRTNIDSYNLPVSCR